MSIWSLPIELLAAVSLVGFVVVLGFLRSFAEALDEARRVEEVRAAMIHRQNSASSKTDGMTRVWTSEPPDDRR